jgi:erythromycin esterase-like protein
VITQKEKIMPTTTDATLTEGLQETAHRLTGVSQDYDPLMDRIGNARFVLLGEASHGTHEFYHERAQITQRLIKEKGFTAVAVEADWPDAYRVNRYLHAASDDVFANTPSTLWAAHQDLTTPQNTGIALVVFKC